MRAALAELTADHVDWVAARAAAAVAAVAVGGPRRAGMERGVHTLKTPALAMKRRISACVTGYGGCEILAKGGAKKNAILLPAATVGNARAMLAEATRGQSRGRLSSLV
jgi:hypothetical protein